MATILDSEDIERSLRRIAHEILERNRGAEDVMLLGIPTRGVTLAHRLQKALGEVGADVPVGSLDITMYRDDLSEVGPNPEVRETKLPFDLNKRVVLLVDDVLYTGRTIRAALEALLDYGRPMAVELLALIDRGRRELPIHADYVGRIVNTSKQEHVDVMLTERDGQDSVNLTTAS